MPIKVNAVEGNYRILVSAMDYSVIKTPTYICEYNEDIVKPESPS